MDRCDTKYISHIRNLSGSFRLVLCVTISNVLSSASTFPDNVEYATARETLDADMVEVCSSSTNKQLIEVSLLSVLIEV